MPQEYTGWNKPKKRGPGRPPKVKEDPAPEHEIHEDGTYTNGKQAKREELKYGDVVSFKDGSSWQVFARREWGVYMDKMPIRRLPSVQQCTFYTYEELDEMKKA